MVSPSDTSKASTTPTTLSSKFSFHELERMDLLFSGSPPVVIDNGSPRKCVKVLIKDLQTAYIQTGFWETSGNSAHSNRSTPYLFL
jgi:hypothetical protein